MVINVYVLGASGVGKSSLDDLFRPEVARIEPYRARTDGARAREEYYVSPPMLRELLRLNDGLDGGPILLLDSDATGSAVAPYEAAGRCWRRWLQVYRGATFFWARDISQVLLHDHDLPSRRKVEIFAPALALIMGDDEARGALPCLKEADKTAFILLNPLHASIRDIEPNHIIDGAGWSRRNWECIQIKRDGQRGKVVKPASVQERIDFLPVEAEAWRSFACLASECPDHYEFVECRDWTHFEYKYLEDDGANAQQELLGARRRILAAASSGLCETLQECMFLPDRSL